MTLLLFVVSCPDGVPGLTGREIGRREGGLARSYHVNDSAWRRMAAARHDGARAFGDALSAIVLPLAIVTPGVAMPRRAGG